MNSCMQDDVLYIYIYMATTKIIFPARRVIRVLVNKHSGRTIRVIGALCSAAAARRSVPCAARRRAA
jgi:hypothetical protein